jgi:proteasome accessory factor A
MKRMVGIETEYGITLEGADDVDHVIESIELIKSYRFDDLKIRWDYSLEDPYRDARGFRAKTLQEDPDEKKYQRQDAAHNLSFEEIKSDLILVNGARLYNDHAHPEYSTPECLGLFELIAYDKAGERILLQCLQRRNRDLKDKAQDQADRSVLLYKNNTDFNGHSYGCHDNYFMSREVKFEYIKACIMPFFVTRQLFAGAGKVGVEVDQSNKNDKNGKPVKYQLSQRADFFMVEASVDTMHQRPIVNTRDEPHADPKKYRRLHGIVSDANMSQYATALKIGSTALVIDLIEAQMITPKNWTLRDPIKAIKEISRDQSLKWVVELHDNRSISAIDIQRGYLALAERFFRGRDEETDWILSEWIATLDELERDAMKLRDRLDWVAKKWLLETFVEAENMEWDHSSLLWLQSLDLEYHNLDPESGLYYELEKKGMMRKVITDEQVENAIYHPPQDTRAYFRGKALEKFRGQIHAIQWDSITFNLDGKQIAVSLNNIVDQDAVNKYKEILDRSNSVSELIENIKKVDS